MTESVSTTDSLSDPRVQELDRAASRACVDLCQAIETATRAGVPAEIIAKYTNKPVSEVQLMIEEIDGLGEDGRLPPQPPPVAPTAPRTRASGHGGVPPMNSVITADHDAASEAR